MLKKIYNWSSSWTGTIIIVLAIIFFIAQAFIIPSGSMRTTLLVGDMLFVKKFSYGVPTPTIPWVNVKVLPDFNNNGHLIEGDRPKRGDIVVFYAPQKALNDGRLPEGTHFVKRAVAVGGDTIFLKDKNLYLHPNEGNEFVKENFSNYETIEIDGKLFIVNPYEKEFQGIRRNPNIVRGFFHQELFDMQAITIPNDEFFMMGDNRDYSNDSRFWGTVPYKNIVGKPWFIYFSWDKDYKIRWDRMFKTIQTIQDETTFDMNFKEDSKGIY
ncbi:signal peptidase I [Aliarcobacter lanthieri]|uniref:signal peptidase I n=1 Tax=Aliarcobacter lanthieri TaxID=1355374 RepID=UPI00047C27EA|nr:signal peptidase I [Aliarcobacter lanthieri]